MRSAVIGAAEGAAGTAAVMPFTMPSREYVGDDIGFADVMLELAIGAALPGAISGAGGWWHSRGGRSWKLELDAGGEAVKARPFTADEMIAESGGARPAKLDPFALARRHRTTEAAAADIVMGRPIETRGLGRPEAETLGDRLRRAPLDGPRWVLTADNQRFLAAEDGTPNLGAAPRVEDGALTTEELPVRLRRGEIKHLDDKLHREDAQELGYSGGVELTLDVARGWTEIREGHSGRILLVKRAGKRSPVAAVELAKVDGADYWRIVSSGARRSDQLGKVLGTREHTPGSASGRPHSFIGGAGYAGDTPRFAQSPRSGDAPLDGASQDSVGPIDPEAPDGVSDTIDHPTAAHENEAAEALAQPETDRAMERARQRREARGTPALPEGFERADPADPKSFSTWVRRALASIRQGVDRGRMTLVGHRVTPGEAAIVRAETGEEIDGFTHIVERSAVRHVETNHGPGSA